MNVRLVFIFLYVFFECVVARTLFDDKCSDWLSVGVNQHIL